MTPTRRTVRAASRLGVTALLVAVAAIAGTVISPGADRSVQAVGELGAGGEFQMLTPARIFDSRNPALDVAPLGAKSMQPLASSGVFDVQVVGRGGLPEPLDVDGVLGDDRVLAVALNITVTGATGKGYLRAFGAGGPEGDTSVVNFLAGTPVPNSVVLRPGRDGKVSIRLVGDAPGTAHVIIDMTGWVSSSSVTTPGARVVPLDQGPARVYDSRVAKFGGTPIGARTNTKVMIRGAEQMDTPGVEVVPNENVVGVVANITAVNRFPGSVRTYVSALPAPVPAGGLPSTSSLNVEAGDARANMAILPVGPDGAIYLFNESGQVGLIVDIVGYLRTGDDESTKLGRVVPLVAPYRAFDTRDPAFYRQPLGPARAEDWSFESLIASVSIGDQQVGAQLGLIGNLTGANLQRQYPWAEVTSFLTAFPTPATGAAVPNVSNLNIGEGSAVPNMVFLTYGERPSSDPGQPGSCEDVHCIRFYNRAGYVHYLLDVSAVILDDG